MRRGRSQLPYDLPPSLRLDCWQVPPGFLHMHIGISSCLHATSYPWPLMYAGLVCY